MSDYLMDIENCKILIRASFLQESSDSISSITPEMNEEERRIRHFLTGLSWDQISEKLMNEYGGDPSAIMNYLGPRESAIYLPAFIILSLQGPMLVDMIFHTTIWRLTIGMQKTKDGKDFAEAISSYLSYPQKIAVCHFVRFLKKYYSEELLDVDGINIKESLDRLWCNGC